MRIEIEAAARKYITDHSPELAITLAVSERPGGAWAGGCAGGARYPSVRLGKANNVHCYLRTECDGIEVYYLDRLPELFAAVDVKVEKLLFWPRLVATGEKR